MSSYPRPAPPRSRVTWLALGVVASLGCQAGCGQRAPLVLRARAHVVAGCAPGDGLLDLAALGDFGPTSTTAETLQLRGGSRRLRLPPDTAAVEARLEAARGGFWSVALRTGDDVFDLPLLPRAAECPLAESPAGRPDYPFATGGEALGGSLASGAALLVGSALDSADAARAIVVDLSTLSAHELPEGLPYAVAGATVTAFGARDLLIAGGVSPLGASSWETAPPLDRAVVFEGERRALDRAGVVLLSRRRADHAAVALPGGDVALVGGRGERGEALDDLEVVSGSDRSVRVVGLARLARARRRPRVAVLDDGRVLVVGGYDAAGTPATGAEWLSPDVSRTELVLESLRVASEHAIAAVPLGGALVIGACIAGTPECDGGPSTGSVVRLDAAGAATPLPPLPVDSPREPVVVEAPDGAPRLWVRSAADEVPRALRFDPWTSAFAPADAPDTSAPLPAPPPLSVDRGLTLWLISSGEAARGSLRAWRHEVRGELSRDLEPLGLASPSHLAPDRAPGAEVSWRPTAGLQVAGDARVLVTDVRFRDVRIELELVGEAPRLGFGPDQVGGVGCVWPRGDGPAVAERRGGEVELSRAGRTSACTVPLGRVPVTVGSAAGGGQVTVRSVRLTRLP